MKFHNRNQIHEAAANFSITDPRRAAIDSADTNANDTLWRETEQEMIAAAQEILIFSNRDLQAYDSIIEAAYDHCFERTLCSITCDPKFYNLSARDLQWFRVRGYIG